MSIASIALAILALGVLIIVHEFGHYWFAKRGGMRVSRFSVGFGPVLLRKKTEETEFVISAVPLGGYVMVDGLNPQDGTDPDDPDGYQRKPFHLKLAMVLGGPFANYVLGFLMLIVFLGAFREVGEPPVRLVEVAPESAAQEAGLVAGDIITGTASVAFTSLDDFGQAIDAAKGSPIPFVVKRNGESKTVIVTPKKKGDVYRVGVSYEAAVLKDAPLPWGEALSGAWTATWKTSSGILIGLASIFDSDARLSGPIGIVKGLSRQVRRSLSTALRDVATLSIALGLFNLLPIPGLDGSRILFLVVAAVRRRPLKPEWENAIHLVGLAALLLLMVVVSYRDIFG